MRSESVRAFFAVDLSPEAREQARRAIEVLREQAPAGVRWTPDENLHLTLKFIGSIAADAVDRLVAQSGAKLAREAQFEVELGGFGAFPSARSAHLLWLGVTRGSPALARLARKLDAAAARLGVERERRPYHGHLTLARLREPHPVPLERMPAPEGPAFRAREVVLYQSHLSGSGASYVPLARLPLVEGPAQDDPDFAPDQLGDTTHGA